MAQSSKYEPAVIWIAAGLKQRARDCNVSVSAVSRWALASEIKRLKNGGGKSNNRIKDTERVSVWLLKGMRDKAVAAGVNIPRAVSSRLRREMDRVEFSLLRGKENRRTSCRDTDKNTLIFIKRRSQRQPKRGGCSNVSEAASRERYKEILEGKRKRIPLYSVQEALRLSGLDSL